MKKHQHNKDFKYGVQCSFPDPHVRYVWINTPPGPPLKWYQRIDWWYWLIMVGVPLMVFGFFTFLYWLDGWDGVLRNLPFLIIGFIVAAISNKSK